MHAPSGETLTLTPDQRERAEKLLKRTIDGSVQTPTDVVDSWNDPDSSIDRERKEGTLPHHEGFVSPSAIEGSLGMSTRLEQGRIKKVLACMLKGEFEVRNLSPPTLQRRGDSFYVTNDGHHRSMVARAIGLEELYAEYTVVPRRFLHND
jgi:hypothetical protein